MINKYDNNSFIEKAKEIHGDKYDYSKINYINSKTKICVICPEHGEFWITPNHVLRGQGCRKCGYKKNTLNQRSNTLLFIEKAKEVHGDKYDYSKVDYIDNSTKVCIICHEHGEFYQTPNSHLNGRGCKICGINQRSSNQRSNTSDFICKAKEIHGDKYDYLKVKYITNRIPITLICKKHGEFEQVPYHHLGGEGCPKCKYENISLKSLHDFEYILTKFKEVHGDKYIYSKVDYQGVDKKVTIICPKHGEFKQEPWVHIKGCGCPKCGVTLSKNEDEIISFLKDRLGNNNVITRDRTILGNRQELDIVIPEKKVCIEYNGLLWHSDKFSRIDKNYHLNKTQLCEEKGYQLIHVFEDEYVNHKDIVLSKLLHILNLNKNNKKINGRDVIIKTITNDVSKLFLENNHLQGYCNSTIHYGAYYNDNLIAVMSFKKTLKNGYDWELTRFASDITVTCRGVGSKLFKHFVKQHNPKSVKSFADRRWTTLIHDNFYNKIGFICDSILKPDYKYFDIQKGKVERIHKFNCRKNKLHKKYGLSLNLTENEMTNIIGLYRIYDCGLIKYKWINNTNK